MKYKQVHRKLRYMGILMVWIISIGCRLLAVLTQAFAMNFYLYYRDIIIHLFHTVPIIVIVSAYASMLYILRQKREDSEKGRSLSNTHAESMNRKMTLMVQRVVICLLICYIPYLVWWQYFNVITIERRDHWEINAYEVIIMSG